MKDFVKIKSRKVINKLFVTAMFAGIIFAWLASATGFDEDIGYTIFFIFLSITFIVAPSILMPYYYSFDDKYVTLHFLFLPSERYLWKNIYDIQVDYDFSRSALLDFLVGAKFVISGTPEGKERFYMKGEICKSRRTKRFLEEYWDGTITGYFTDDVKSFFKRKRDKITKNPKKLSNDEVAQMERQIRAELRTTLAPLITQVKHYGLELRTKYVYVTNSNCEELNSRPDEAYAYTVSIELSEPDETDETKIICFDVELIWVRLGKRSYRGVANSDAIEELQAIITEALEEIQKIGMEAYCKENN
ncbi:MAG: hypothetical protein IKJ00_01865 [Clostridia bacterium]|nr:hypothetical protein [Clostridia bacterium]